MNAEDTERALKNTLSLEFQQAKLTQKGGKTPRVYKGQAEITQLVDGSLKLKLCHVYDSQDKLFEELFEENNTSPSGIKLELGQIIEDDHYFDFEG